MKKTEQEVLMIQSADYHRVIESRRRSWAFLVLRKLGLADDQIEAGFGEDVKKWLETAAVAGIDVLLMPDEAIEIRTRSGDNFRWEPVRVVRQREPAPGKKVLLFNWTEPD